MFTGIYLFVAYAVRIVLLLPITCLDDLTPTQHTKSHNLLSSYLRTAPQSPQNHACFHHSVRFGVTAASNNI